MTLPTLLPCQTQQRMLFLPLRQRDLLNNQIVPLERLQLGARSVAAGLQRKTVRATWHRPLRVALLLQRLLQWHLLVPSQMPQ